MAEQFNFQFVPTSGDLSGVALGKQTERAINELGEFTYNAQVKAEEAYALAQNALTTSNDALATANNALTAAQNAQNSANDATALANTALTAAQNAQDSANQALTSAADAQNSANQALGETTQHSADIAVLSTKLDEAAALAQEALAIAESVRGIADSAMEAANQALGIFENIETINADTLMEPTRYYVENGAGITKLPLALGDGVFLQTIINSALDTVNQSAWSKNVEEEYRRFGNITYSQIAGTDAAELLVSDLSGNIINAGSFNVTATTTGVEATFTPGNFTETSSTESTLSGIISFTTATRIEDGSIALAGATVVAISAGDVITPLGEFTTPFGTMEFVSGIQNNDVVELTIIYRYKNLGDPVLTWDDWSVSGGGGSIPAGIITMWSGAVVDVPNGWALCDGDNGTPNLRDRFIIGAGSTYGSGASGGSTTHNHTITVGATTLTTAQIPAHSHYKISGNNGQNNSLWHGSNAYWSAGWADNAVNIYTSNTGGGGSHTHSASTANVTTLPPYYALAFIMKL